MQALTFADKRIPLRTVLCLGAHCDDIEIGCGGTILRLAAERPDLHVHWIVFSSDSVRAKEARHSADRFLEHTANKTILVRDFRNGFFPYVATKIKEYFEELKADVSPDLILTHYRGDLHQDHRTISELTWNTFRDHLILEYEIPKYDGDLGSPNIFVGLPESVRDNKVQIILESFASQKDKHWFSADTFRAMMRLRGMESNASSGYAEAFYCRKVVVDLGLP
jgi:LmbE family N-acetylglucosaminyl deacetylase